MNQAQVIGHIMVKTGVRAPEFARRNQLATSTFYEVAAGRAKTAHVRKLISDTIGVPVPEIWPEKKSG